MKPLQILKKWLRDACVWFTVLSLSMLLIGILFLSDMDYISTLSYLLFLPFGLCMSAAGLLLSVQRLSTFLRWLFHYIITILSLVLFLVLPSGTTFSFPMAFFFFLLFSMIYWISVCVIHILRTNKKSGEQKRR